MTFVITWRFVFKWSFVFTGQHPPTFLPIIHVG